MVTNLIGVHFRQLKVAAVGKSRYVIHARYVCVLSIKPLFSIYRHPAPPVFVLMLHPIDRDIQAMWSQATRQMVHRKCSKSY